MELNISILFGFKKINSLIRPIDGILTQVQSEPEINGNEGLLHIP